MGGAQTLEIAIQRLQDYGYVGVFSSGVFTAAQSDEWATKYRAQLDDAHAKPGLETLWFSTGSDDFLLGTTKATVAMFEKHGFRPVFKESTGGHTWINWRDYLHELTPQLFK
jgi:enterochelin esterase family protein